MLDRTLAKLEPKLLPVALLLCRLSLGGMFLLSGFGKVMGELKGFPENLGAFRNGYYAVLQPSFVPDLIATPYGYALPWIELILGALLVLGLFGRVTALLVSFVMVSILVSQVNAHGITATDDPGPPFNPNYVLLSLALLLTLLGPGKLALDTLLRGRKKR